MIKKFEEYNNGQVDIEGDVGEEYAKVIISKYIDEDANGKSLEDIFYSIGKGDELIDVDDAIIYSIIEYLEDMLSQAKKLRKIKDIALDKETKKFNL